VGEANTGERTSRWSKNVVQLVVGGGRTRETDRHKEVTVSTKSALSFLEEARENSVGRQGHLTPERLGRMGRNERIRNKREKGKTCGQKGTALKRIIT